MNRLLLAAAAALAMAGANGAIASDWEYEGLHGTDHWAEIDPAFAACGTGHMQSPVDLAEVNVEGAVSVATNWIPAPLAILNNGHTVQANVPGGSTMRSSGKTFRLMQVHFHTESEHTLERRHFPMEAHFVHASDTGELAVLGVLFTWGEHNAELQKLIDAAPRGVSGPLAHPEIMFDPAALLPQQGEAIPVYRYMGSLTTPPCTEGVNWHVAIRPVEASQHQLAELRAIMHDNARPVQPLYERLLIAAR